jgi:hypothetical protein
LQSYEHHPSLTREEARERLGRSITVPDYAQLVNAMAGERISIATEMVMAHLSIHIRMGHALQKKGRWAVGRHSPRDDIARAKDLCRFIGDQIEMMQYIRGRVGGDRDAILSMQDRPDLGPKASTLSKGTGRSEDAASKCAMEPASNKRARMTNGAQAPCSHSTVATKGRFIPPTPEIEKAGGPSTTEYDRGFSDTSDDERRGLFSVMNSSEYSPVSGVAQEPREVKTEDQAELLCLAQSAQVLTQHQPTT